MGTNKVIDLSNIKTKTKRKPKVVKDSEKLLKKAHGVAKSFGSETNTALMAARKNHRSVIRKLKIKEDQIHDAKLHAVLSSNPTNAFKTIKAAKSSKQSQVPFIRVGDLKYEGDKVVDGFF